MAEWLRDPDASRRGVPHDRPQDFQQRKDDRLVALLAGELENLIVASQIAHASMVTPAETADPGPESSNGMLCRRTMFVKAVTDAATKAMELAGGAGFYRSAGIERCFRDIQGARYHPMPEKPQAELTGRFVPGLGFDS